MLLYEVLRDWQKGGLNPSNFQEFTKIVESLPPMEVRNETHLRAFDRMNLTDISEEEFPAILREANIRLKNSFKICWHPDASLTTCDTDSAGNIKVSAAHSIQNNGILKAISEDGYVVSYDLMSGSLDGKALRKNIASTFWGFCNVHDAIFYPIETAPYTSTDEQNFLFAYRAFVVSAHSKLVTSQLINYGEQSDNDIERTKAIFDRAIRSSDYSIIDTEVFELPTWYPFAAASSFYLEFDFLGTPIEHSDERMEDVFVTFFPDVNRSFFLLSYFKSDRAQYKNLGDQLRMRNNLKSDISVILVGHTENIYFNPIYHKTFIESQLGSFEKLITETQLEAQVDGRAISTTPSDYLSNKYEINLFGY